MFEFAMQNSNTALNHEALVHLPKLSAFIMYSSGKVPCTLGGKNVSIAEKNKLSGLHDGASMNKYICLLPKTAH